MSIKLKGSSDGSVSFDAPADTSPSGSDITLTLPTSAGSANQFLKNSGIAGELEYSSMVETSTGIGIGTTSPSRLLTVQSTGNANLCIKSGTSGVSQCMFGDTDSDVAGNIAYRHSDNAMAFEVNGSEKVRISSAGNLGIGTSSPSRPFTNAGAITLTTGGAPQYRLNGGAGDSNDNDRAIFGLATGNNHFFSGTVAGDTVLRTTSGGKLLLGTGTEERFRIASNGRITAQVVYGTPLSGTTRDVFIEDGGQLGYISSVRDSKANISLLSNVDWIYQLQPSSFNYKLTDQEGAYTGQVNTELEYGLIAEDVEPVAPELCFYDEVDGEQELRGVHYKKLIVPMLKALQEANTKITALETKVAALEAA